MYSCVTPNSFVLSTNPHFPQQDPLPHPGKWGVGRYLSHFARCDARGKMFRVPRRLGDLTTKQHACMVLSKLKRTQFTSWVAAAVAVASKPLERDGAGALLVFSQLSTPVNYVSYLNKIRDLLRGANVARRQRRKMNCGVCVCACVCCVEAFN